MVVIADWSQYADVFIKKLYFYKNYDDGVYDLYDNYDDDDNAIEVNLHTTVVVEDDVDLTDVDDNYVVGGDYNKNNDKEDAFDDCVVCDDNGVVVNNHDDAYMTTQCL